MRKPFEQRPGTSSRRWLPPGLPETWVDDPALRYVVVDEVLEGSVTLAVTRWPELDRRGRLRFGRTPPLSVGVDQAKVVRVLAARIVAEESSTGASPSVVAERPVRVGDVFAVREARPLSSLIRGSKPKRRGSGDYESAPAIDPEDWIAPPVYDLTAEARDAAKLAYYAAASVPVDRKEVEARIAGELQPRQPDPYDLLSDQGAEGE
jgi:hypothetical protein